MSDAPEDLAGNSLNAQSDASHDQKAQMFGPVLYRQVQEMQLRSGEGHSKDEDGEGEKEESTTSAESLGTEPRS